MLTKINGLIFTATAMAVAAMSPAQAQTTPKATFALTSDMSSTKASNIASATFSSNESAYIGNDGFGNVLEQYTNSPGTGPAGAVLSGSYVSYALTAENGQTLGINSISFDVGKGGNADPRGFFIRSSLDNFNTDIFSEVLPSGAVTAPVNTVVGLSEAFAGLSAATFRFYNYSPVALTGFTYSVDFRNVSFNSAVASVPEPATWLTMILGFGLVGFALRGATRRSEQKFDVKIKRIEAGHLA